MTKLFGMIVMITIFVGACTGGSRSVSTWDGAYGGADKSYDTDLLRLREAIAPQFRTMQFHDAVTGKILSYSLYTPENYDAAKKYPLVLFMADGSTTGKGVEAPLKQGYGGIIWATKESQAQNPCFVLVPAYSGPENAVNDKWEVSDEVHMTFRLLTSIISSYSIDDSRVYATGQSMGGMISFYLNANYPDLFAASIFVASQWDINVLAPLAEKKFFYIVSEADQKASAGMRELGDMLEKKGVVFGMAKFSANIPDNEQEKYIKALLASGHDINFVQFTTGTVLPAGTAVSERLGAPGGEHMYSFDYAYKLKGVREWLFRQRGE